jgi:hypothetical protein
MYYAQLRVTRETYQGRADWPETRFFQIGEQIAKGKDPMSPIQCFERKRCTEEELSIDLLKSHEWYHHQDSILHES